ncbi:hypothetical protein CIC12_20815 [Burkholderia sp. SG-MS1]|nr:hypothetical protein [Paraburkholderia sp. SG-MS1]
MHSVIGDITLSTRPDRGNLLLMSSGHLSAFLERQQLGESLFAYGPMVFRKELASLHDEAQGPTCNIPADLDRKIKGGRRLWLQRVKDTHWRDRQAGAAARQRSLAKDGVWGHAI